MFAIRSQGPALALQRFVSPRCLIVPPSWLIDPQSYVFHAGRSGQTKVAAIDSSQSHDDLARGRGILPQSCWSTRR